MLEQIFWHLSNQKSIYGLDACNIFTSKPLENCKLNSQIVEKMEEIKMEGLGMNSNHIDGLDQFEVSNFYKVVQ